MSALASPLQVLLNFQECIILREGLEHGEAENGRTVSNGVLSFDLLESIEVVRVGGCMQLQDFIVDLACELPINDISQDLPLCLKLSLDRNAGQDLLVEPMNLTDLQGQGISNLLLSLFDQFIDDLADYLIISLDLQQLKQVQILVR